MSETVQPSVFSESNILGQLQLTTLNEVTVEGFLRLYSFPLIFTLIYITLIGCYLILHPKVKRNIFLTISVFIATIPLSYFGTKTITDRDPPTLKEAIKYNASYNLIYSNVLKLKNGDLYFVPSKMNKSNENKDEDFDVNINNPIFKTDNISVIKVSTDAVRRIYFNEKSFPDPLSNQTLNICSIFLFVDPGHGDLSNNQYISFSWNQHELLASCKITSENIVKLIGKAIDVAPTNASVFEYEYPKNKDEFNAGLLTDTYQSTDENNHNHENEHDHEH